MDPVFASFVAKLFQNSFRSNVVKQDFRLNFDRSLDTMVGLIYRHIGIQSLSKVLNGERLNTFNSSSIAANLLLKLLQRWSPMVKSNKALKVPPHKRVFTDIIHRIAMRRTCASSSLNMRVPILGTPRPKRPLRNSLRAFMSQYPMKPYFFPDRPDKKSLQKFILHKLKAADSLHWDTIIRSAISEHERHCNYTALYRGHPFKSVRNVEKLNSVR